MPLQKVRKRTNRLMVLLGCLKHQDSMAVAAEQGGQEEKQAG